MRRVVGTVLGALIGVLVSGSFPNQAEEPKLPELKTVLERHVAARGGAESWAKVKALKLTGTWEAFSTPGPYTEYRTKAGRWRFEPTLFGQSAILAYDGEHTWIQGAALDAAEPTRLEDAWKRNLLEDARWLHPLLAVGIGAGKGISTKLTGFAKIEGRNALAIQVTQEGLSDETWYLDASSYLEIKRESTTFDVFSGGIETPMETFYDDFRKVDGLVLPFHEERSFGTRYHVTDVETVVVNPEIDPAVFTAPPPAPEPEADPDQPG